MSRVAPWSLDLERLPSGFGAAVRRIACFDLPRIRLTNGQGLRCKGAGGQTAFFLGERARGRAMLDCDLVRGGTHRIAPIERDGGTFAALAILGFEERRDCGFGAGEFDGTD